MFKTFAAQFASLIRTRRGRRNIGILAKYFGVLAVLVTTYSIVFHVLMEWEGKQYSWITGFYWMLEAVEYGLLTLTMVGAAKRNRKLVRCLELKPSWLGKGQVMRLTRPAPTY